MPLDLLSLFPVPLRRVASTGGGRGEFAGPCPLCGGKDRCHVQPDYQWADGDIGAWMCRQCNPHWQDAIALVRATTGCSYRDALAVLGQEKPAALTYPQTPVPPPAPIPPPPEWQARAHKTIGEAIYALHSDKGANARGWLHQRGFLETVVDAALGYNPVDRWDDPTAWGLPVDSRKVWLPRGIVIPWEVDGHLWNVEIRRPLTAAQIAAGETKYISVRGGTKQAMLGADRLDSTRPTLLVEGAFDRMAVLQTAGDLVNVVAAGSTTGGRQSTWVLRLAAQSEVLVSLDADEAGDEASAWWLTTLGERARRWRPDYADPAAMLQSGADLRAWVLAGIRKDDPAAVVRGEVISLDDVCGICGAPVERYTEGGTAVCLAHYDVVNAGQAWNALGQHERRTA